MDVLRFAVIAVTGFTACSEFGSFAFVHPVVRQLPTEHHLTVEQGLLKTFGRAMPVLMPATAGLTVADAVRRRGTARAAALGAAGAAVAGVVVTLVGNVPINSATARWDPASPPPDWKAQRGRWERLQAVRASLLLASFAMVVLSTSLDG